MMHLQVERITNASPATENVTNRIKRLYEEERDAMSGRWSDAFGIPLDLDESGNAAPLLCVKNHHSVTLPAVTLSEKHHTAAHVSAPALCTAAIDGFAPSVVCKTRQANVCLENRVWTRLSQIS